MRFSGNDMNASASNAEKYKESSMLEDIKKLHIPKIPAGAPFKQIQSRIIVGASANETVPITNAVV
jgi:hypothetical protein